MDDLQEFIRKLKRLLDENNFEISSSMDIDLHRKDSSGLVGFWPSEITVDSFRDLR